MVGLLYAVTLKPMELVYWSGTGVIKPYCVRHWWSLKCLGWAYLAILVRKSIFENPVLINIVLGCRNKCARGHLALIELGLALAVGVF
jgi:hypothetical protein